MDLRTPVFAAACLLLLPMALSYADEDEALVLHERPPAREAAEAVRKAHSAKDGAVIERFARQGKPGPWDIADELCALGAHDAARALVEAGAEAVVAGLAEAIDALETSPAPKPHRAAFRRAVLAVEANEHAEARKQLDTFAGKATGILAARAAEQRGLAARGQHDLAASKAAFEDLLARAKALGWSGGMAAAHAQLGVNAYRTRNAQGALQHWKAAAALYMQLGFKEREASTLANLGSLFNAVGQNATAERLLGQAMALYREARDAEGVARVLTNRASTAWNLKRHDEAAALLKQALAIQDRHAIEPAATRTRVNLAGLQLEVGRSAEAAKLYQELLPRLEGAGQEDARATAQLNLGTALQRLGRMGDAVEPMEAAWKTYRTLGDPEGVADAARNLGNLLIESGELARAEELLTKSAAHIGGGAGEPLRKARFEGVWGVLRSRQGRFDDALTHYGKARAGYDALGKTVDAAYVLQSIAALHGERGDYAEALTAYDEAIEVLEGAGDAGGLASALSNRAALALRLQRTDEAIALLERSLELVAEAGDRRQEAYTAGNLAGACMRNGDFDRALELYERSRDLSRALGLPIAEANATGNMGTLLRRMGKREHAVTAYRDALALHRKTGNPQGEASTLSSLAGYLSHLGRHDEALPLLEQAIAITTEQGYVRLSASALGNLAMVQRAMGTPRDALATSRRADAAMRRIHGRLSDEGAAQARAAYAAMYRNAIAAASDAKDPAAAFEFMERGRSAALLEALGGRARLSEVVLDPALRGAEAAARAAEGTALAAYRRARTLRDPRRVRKQKQAWEKAQAATEAVVRRIQREAKAAAEVVYAEPMSLADAQARLQGDQALVLYALMPQTSHALVVTKTAARLVTLVDEERIGAATDALLSALEQPAADVDGPGKELATLVLEPLGLTAETPRVAISPSGPLCYVPLGLLADGARVSQLPSASVGLRVVERPPAGRDRVLALGDPAYDQKSKAGASRLRSGFNLVRLPATRVEAETVGDLVLLGADATETGFRTRVASSPAGWRAVHFACHGLVDPEHPLRSALALTPAAPSDGFLTALEVMQIPMATDLVVLSACETGKGKYVEGEGTLGLTRSFMFAGAGSVLCSLWKVDDEATRALILKFYELWNAKDAAKRMDAAAALKAAQAHVRTFETKVVDPDASRKARRTVTKTVRPWAHPHYWAAWVLWKGGA